MKMATVTMTMEEYLQLLNGLSSEMMSDGSEMVQVQEEPKPKRRTTAYQRRYRANFRKIQSEYKLKNGNWKKNGFKRAVQAAHRMSKK
jgi:hypothetical protein